MPKKNLGHRVSHFSSLDEKDLSKIFDLSLGESEQDDAEMPVDEDDLIKTLHIKPAGYPIKPLDAPDQITLSINEDPKLFQAYAAEQWGGLSVRVNDFIFDQGSEAISHGGFGYFEPSRDFGVGHAPVCLEQAVDP